jgi:hypothetical protein
VGKLQVIGLFVNLFLGEYEGAYLLYFPETSCAGGRSNREHLVYRLNKMKEHGMMGLWTTQADATKMMISKPKYLLCDAYHSK